MAAGGLGSSATARSGHAVSRWRLLAAAIVQLCAVAFACGAGASCTTLANATAACVRDADCPSGRCLAGLCAAAADAVAGRADAVASDAQADQADGDAALAKCVTAVDCDGIVGTTSACTPWACVEGRCVPTKAPDGTVCATQATCSAAGACDNGTCFPTGTVCDDGNDCTVDACASSGCKHDPFPKLPAAACKSKAGACLTGVCDGSGQCATTLAAGFCVIDGLCHKQGAVLMDEPCLRCLPTAATSTWTEMTSGPCEDGDACTSGDQCDESGNCSGPPAVCASKDSCAIAACQQGVGCVQIPVAGTCTDGDPCSDDDLCADGKCAAGTPKDCDDANPCTKDTCTAGFGCLHTPQPGPCAADADPCTADACIGGVCTAKPIISVCTIGGVCVPVDGSPDGQPCLSCKPDKSTLGWTLLDAVACNDGNACTTADTCLSGKCEGLPVTCNDKNPCTADSCSPDSGCTFAPIAAACNDQDACTKSDQCLAGACSGTPIPPTSCDDSNICTADACSAAYGCTNTPNTAPCSDGDPCTKSDHCLGGVCQSGGVVCPCESAADCDDKNPCTVDSCGAKSCKHVPTGGQPCDDANACTQPDMCSGSLCASAPVVCDDKNPCTSDSCVAEVGCLAQPLQGKACNDSDACTANDLCIGGVCMGTPKNCDDANPCTVDSCVAATGACIHPAFGDGTACSGDGVACTLDMCKGGLCTHDKIASDACLITGACVSGGAIHPVDPCLGCLPKVNQFAWSSRAGLPCSDGNICTANEICAVAGQCAGELIDCGDQNPCTLDACNPQAPAKPCFSVPVAGPCNDGSACSVADTCVQGKCVGIAIGCDDGNPCTVDGCTQVAGCTHAQVAAGQPCTPDDLPCTENICDGGACTAKVAAGWCLIAALCQPSGTPHPTSACQSCQPAVSTSAWSPSTGAACSDGNPCTAGDTCQSGKCTAPAGAACDDGNPCTTDSCAPTTGCVNKPVAAAPCNDGNACTSDDACVSGNCVGKVVVCPTSSAAAAQCKVATCDAAVGCTAVTTCPVAHACVGGQCLTVPTGATTPGAVAVPLPAGLVPAAAQPSVRWHDAGTGALATVPHLWLAFRTQGCGKPGDAAGSLGVAHLAPFGAAIDVTVAPPPSGTVGCASHPRLVAHPASYAHLAVSWAESHAGCATGALRLGVVSPTAKLFAPPAPCLGAAVGRPAVALKLAAGGDPLAPSGLGGIWAASAGATAWQLAGEFPNDWGKLQALPLQVAPFAASLAMVGRGSVTGSLPDAWYVAPAQLAVDGGGAPIATLQLAKPVGAGQWGATAVVATDIDAIADQLSYDAAEAAWDPESARIGVVASGAMLQGGQPRALIAWLRLNPTSSAPAVPSLLQTFDAPTLAAARVAAIQIAELPASPDFLVAWTPPATKTILVARLKPIDDKKVLTVWSQTVAKDFAGVAPAQAWLGGGGVSELVLAPKSDRFTIAWESQAGLSISTLPISGPP